MSQPAQIPQTSQDKPPLSHDDDAIIAEVPSNFDIALNGYNPNRPRYFLSPNQTSKSTTSGLLDPEASRRLSISTVSSRGISPYPIPPQDEEPRTWKSPLWDFWHRNEGIILVILSQAFGALMNVTARLLELEGDGMRPFQILFARMVLTALCCCGWLWWQKIPLLGSKEVRGLLVLRGLCGFFGIYGMYYSLQYLPMADAVVITFLAPSVAAYGCYLCLREPFPRSAQLASLVSLLGVVLIARPTSFFTTPTTSIPITLPNNSTTAATESTSTDFANPTSAQRLSAIALALLGVLGSAGAFTAIRLIGTRAHPLISVNYFSIWCSIVSTVVLSITHTFQLPRDVRQWSMLIVLGFCGFAMQYLLTRGLAARHSGGARATNMIYTNMLFALALDRLVFNVTPGWWSLAGSGCILASAAWVAMYKDADAENEGAERVRVRDEEAVVEETVGLTSEADEEAEERLHQRDL
ncbi:hypothetical protein BP6252_12220 [Coleophoma cylindrospora]|uniref:EamA domain-containing protein n=1 Tax=Coleophoma cylindrospora TaxID=1849047 RepID=A0A3D8QGG8_9HELO|nr:hypothetical protein BP6252_12220 [Coleophoma cylindrospora]